MQTKSLILFMPSIEGGGVEKNLIIISNYFTKRIKSIKLISADAQTLVPEVEYESSSE